MNESNNDLLLHLDQLHTTELGVERIKRNLSISVEDVVSWCKSRIKKENALITRKGKNWYVYIEESCITVNAYSYTIITAHKVRENL